MTLYQDPGLFHEMLRICVFGHRDRGCDAALHGTSGLICRLEAGRRVSTILAAVCVILACDFTPSFAADVNWVGDQTGFQVGQTASFFDDSQWSQSLGQKGPGVNDTAVFNDVFFRPGEISRYIKFGDFMQDLPPSKNPTLIPGGDATIDGLKVQNGVYTFMLDGNSMNVSTGITVGSQYANKIPGSATLTVRHGQLNQTVVDNWSGLTIGDGLGVTGTLVIDGADASVNVARDVSIGNGGGSGVLQVVHGGQISARNIGDGIYNGPSGEMSTSALLVSDVGSVVHGFAGFGHTGSINVANGGHIDSQSRFAFLGITNGATTTAGVSGAGSQWDNIDRLTVGGVYHSNSTAHGILDVTSGGRVAVASLYVADSVSSTGDVTVSGAGSQLAVSGIGLVGSKGGGTLAVSSGGAVATRGGTIGNAAGSTGAVVVSGAGSSFASDSPSTANFAIANQGHGSLTVSNGAAFGVHNGNTFVGQGAGSVGTATLTDVGSTWNSSSNLYVGYSATSQGALNVAHGAQLSVGTLLEIGLFGAGSLNVQSGGKITSVNGYVGDGAGASGQVSISSGGVWTVNGVFDAGFLGTATVSVDGAGSALNAGGTIIGDKGTASLVISNGGTVSSYQSAVGLNGAVATATVTGSGSQWNESQGSAVGFGGGANGTLTISAGGHYNTPYLDIALLPNSTGRIDVIGSGSLLQILTTGTPSVGPAGILNVGGTDDIVNGVGTFPAGPGGAATLSASSGGLVAVPNLLRVWGAGSVDVTGGGAIHIGTGALSQIAGAVQVGVGGTLAGSGIVHGNTVVKGGTLAPNVGVAKPGTLTLDNTSLDSASTFAFQLGAPGTVGAGVNGLIKVNGNLTLAGGLNVAGLTGFRAGDYRLFDYTGALTFNAPTIALLPAGYAADILTSNAGQIDLRVTKYGVLAGDVNGDTIVDIQDIGLIVNHWRREGNYLPGDANRDGAVDIQDIGLVTNHWLHSSGGGGAAVETLALDHAAVPEPATAVLSLLGALSLALLKSGALRRQQS